MTKERDDKNSGIYQRDGKWLVKLELARDRATGKRRFHYSRHATEAEARRKRDEVLRDLEQGALVRKSHLTINQWFDHWLQKELPFEVSPATAMHYEGQLKHVRRHLGGMKLQAVELEDVNVLWKALAAGYEHNGRQVKLARSSIYLVRTTFRGAMKAAIGKKHIVRNPVSGSEVPKRDPVADQNGDEAPVQDAKAFTAQEVGRILRGLREMQSDLYMPAALAEATGMRGQETCALRWRDVHLDAEKLTGLVHVRAAVEVQRGKKTRLKGTKTDRPRDVAIEGPIVAELLQCRAKAVEVGLALGLQLGEDWFVFPASPEAPTQYRSPKVQSGNFARVAARFGIKRPTFHRLRHYHATMLLRQGERVEVVAERLGHANVATTLEFYASVLDEMKEKAAATAGRISREAHDYQPTQGTVTPLRKSK